MIICRRVISFIFLLICTCGLGAGLELSSHAQSKSVEIDSLKPLPEDTGLLTNESKKIFDDTKLVVTNKLDSNNFFSIQYQLKGESYEQRGVYDSALLYYEKAILLSENDSLSIEYFFSKAYLLDVWNQFDSSILYYEKTISLSNNTNLYHRQADAHFYLGAVYNYIGENQSALQHTLLAKHYYDSISPEENQWHIYNILGIVYEETALYAKSLQHYLIALDLAEKEIDPEALMKVSNNIAIFYSLNKDSQLALKHLEKALELAKVNDLKEDECYILSNIGEELLILDDSIRSKRYIDRSINLYKELGDSCEISYAMNSLALYYIKYDMLEEARAILNEAYVISDKCGLDGVSAELNRHLAEVNVKLGFDDSAIENLRTSLAYAQLVGFVHDQRDAQFALYEIYKRLKNDQFALESFEQYHLLKDSLHSETERQKLAIINTELIVSAELKDAQFDIKARLLERKAKESILEEQVEFQSFYKYVMITLLVLLIALMMFCKRKKANG